MRGTLFIVSPYGTTTRDVLRTDVLNILKSKIPRIVIFSPAAKEEYFIKEFAGGNVIIEELLPYRLGMLEMMFRTVKKDLLANAKFSGKVLGTEVAVKLTKHPIIRLFRRILFNSIYKSKKFRNFLEKIDPLLFPDRLYAKTFEKYKPALVFVAYPFHTSTFPVLRRARQNGVSIIAFISSWDNLTTKADFPVRMDKLIVWNEIMKKEAMELHGYLAGNIYVSGGPQFDIYINKKDMLASRDEFIKKIGGDPRKKLITYATGAAHGLSLGPAIIDTIDEAIKKGELAAPCQLLVRLHFKDRPSYYERYRNNENIIVEPPGRASKVFVDGWDPTIEDMLHLANTLLHTDVLVNVASTMTIDACCFDTPVVNIGFDGREKKPYWESVIRYCDLTYYKNVIRAGGVKVARNKEELIQYINDYLKNPKLDTDGRKRVVKEQCYMPDGKSWERMANMILNFWNVKGKEYE